MRVWALLWQGCGVGLLIGGWLVGCAALADPAEEAVPDPPTQRPVDQKQRIQSVVLPVANATGLALRLAPDLHLGLFEPLVSPSSSRQVGIPELIQAGFILKLEKSGRHPAPMAWTNTWVPDAPVSVEAAWRLASSERLDGDIIWIRVTDWDDRAWRQRSIIHVSAEVVVFRAGQTESLRTKVYQRQPFVIPQLSTVAQAAGHIGMRMASEMFP
jgi:hypothetical protein